MIHQSLATVIELVGGYEILLPLFAILRFIDDNNHNKHDKKNDKNNDDDDNNNNDDCREHSQENMVLVELWKVFSVSFLAHIKTNQGVYHIDRCHTIVSQKLFPLLASLLAQIPTQCLSCSFLEDVISLVGQLNNAPGGLQECMVQCLLLNWTLWGRSVSGGGVDVIRRCVCSI